MIMTSRLAFESAASAVKLNLSSRALEKLATDSYPNSSESERSEYEHLVVDDVVL